MNQKDSVKALAVANELLIKAGANDLGKLELAFLSAKVDSIKLKVSPSKQLASNTVRGSKILPPTGATLVNGNIQIDPHADTEHSISNTNSNENNLTKNLLIGNNSQINGTVAGCNNFNNQNNIYVNKKKILSWN